MRTASRTLRFLRGGVVARAAAVAFFACAPFGASAALFGDDEARRAIIDLRGRLEVQGREQNRRIEDLAARLDDRVTRLEERIARLEQSTRGQLELQNQIELLRQEVAALRGQAEVQANELAQTQRRQRELVAEIDGRVKRLEPVQVQIDGRTADVDPEERRQFEAALGHFRAGEFREALGGFQQLRTRWPASAYLPAVLFWTGSAQYAVKDYKAAISSHETFLARFPDHPRASDALFGIGLAQAESGDRKVARKTLESVISRHPGTPAAQMARERLATLR